MVTLVATIQAKKEHRDDLKQILTGLVAKVENEKGTIQYILHQSEKDDCRFLFYETYTDHEALGFHAATDYFKAAMKQMAPYLAGKPEIETYQKVVQIKES